jgi:hypothetical protein
MITGGLYVIVPQLALVRSAGRWLISGQLGVIETDRVADKRSTRPNSPGISPGAARHVICRCMEQTWESASM